MKKIIILGFVYLLGMIALIVQKPNTAYAGADVNEVASHAAVTTFNVSTSTAVDMSSSTLVGNVVAYNITNTDSTNTLYCGYTSTVAVSGNYQGFKILPGASQYRAIKWPAKVYCIASTLAITITRELFGIN